MIIASLQVTYMYNK